MSDYWKGRFGLFGTGPEARRGYMDYLAGQPSRPWVPITGAAAVIIGIPAAALFFMLAAADRQDNAARRRMHDVGGPQQPPAPPLRNGDPKLLPTARVNDVTLRSICRKDESCIKGFAGFLSGQFSYKSCGYKNSDTAHGRIYYQAWWKNVPQNQTVEMKKYLGDKAIISCPDTAEEAAVVFHKKDPLYRMSIVDSW